MSPPSPHYCYVQEQTSLISTLFITICSILPNGDSGPVWAEAAADGGYWLVELSVKQKQELTSTETNCLWTWVGYWFTFTQNKVVVHGGGGLIINVIQTFRQLVPGWSLTLELRKCLLMCCRTPECINCNAQAALPNACTVDAFITKHDQALHEQSNR